MAGNIKGLTVEIGGDTTKLGKALEDVNKKSRNLSSELGEVNRLLKMDPGNADLLAQKQQILAEAVANTKQKLDTLKEAEAQVQAQFARGEVSEEQVRALQREIIATTGKLEQYENAAKETAEAIEEIGTDSKDAGEGAKDLAGSVEEAGDAADDAGGGGFTIMKGALADLVSDVIQSAISAIGDLIGSLFELSEATEEYRSMQAKLGGAAESFGYSVDFANEKYAEFYRYLGDDQMATNAITNLMGLGTSTESVSALAEGATAVWASYGDSIPIESLTESINETIQVGKVTGTMADTVNWAADAQEQLQSALSGNTEAQSAFNAAIEEGLPVEDAFNEALATITDTQERADVVAQFLNETYGKSKDTYDEVSGSILDANEAELALKDTQGKLGKAMEPVNTALTNLKNQALQAITPLVQTLADAFMNLYNWMQQHPAVAQALTGILIGLAAAFTVLATALGIQALIKGVTTAFQSLNLTMLSNPIVLIIAAIAALVAAFVYLWNNCEAFREFWINLWENIKAVFSAVWEAIKTTVTTVMETISTFLSNVWNGIKTTISTVLNTIKTTVSKVWNGIKTTISKVLDTIQTTVSNIWNGIKTTISKVLDGIKTTVSNVWNGIKSTISNILNGIKSTVSDIWNGIKSTVSNVVDSIKSTVSDKFTAIKDSISDKINAARDAVKNAIDRIKEFFNFKFTWPHIPLPHFSISPPGWKIGDLLKGSIPRLGIDWYAKGGVMTRPTIFGMAGGNLLGGGEAGPEAIAPIDVLQDYVSDAVERANQASDTALLSKLDRILDAIEKGQILTIDGNALVGATADKYDATLGQRRALAARGAV